MEEPKGIGYEGFAKWERDLARIKAKKKASVLNRTAIDWEDLEQEFLIQIWLRRQFYQTEHQSHSSLSTFINRVLENRFMDILRSEKMDKRIIHEEMDSLQREFETDEGMTVTLQEKLADESLPEPQDPNADLQKTFEQAIGALTQLQKDIYRRIQAGQNLQTISKELRLPWTSVKRKVVRMRQVLYDAGLSDFVESGEFSKKSRKK